MAFLVDTSILVRLANTADALHAVATRAVLKLHQRGELLHITVVGKQVHDARLVAVCHVHGVTNLLTFNVAHFAPLARFGAGVMIVDPASV